ncbi:MAG TPA: phosphatase PAP2 family protein [Cytophagaceae bacterium]|jgi:membrane-associated phospholipid phosphatase|nr:phosphatase PAP2 family protein [Cytophagaceae bacterium]
MKKIFLFLFILLSRTIEAQNVDINLLNTINPQQANPSATVFFKDISSSAYIVSIAAPVSVFSIGVLKKDKVLRYKSYQMVAGIGLTMSLSFLLKHAVNRPRPYETYSFISQKVKENSSSFPSSHTAAAFETATSLSLNFPKWYVIIPAYTWASAVGYSRMYLGVHYPSDVAAGMLIGAGSAWLSWKLNQKLQKKRLKL